MYVVGGTAKIAGASETGIKEFYCIKVVLRNAN